MYELFKNRNEPRLEGETKGTYALGDVKDIRVKNLFAECGGYSFQNGIYKVHTAVSSFYWSTLISGYYTKYKERIIPFGYDWLGRQYAVDLARENHILMFDPSTAEDMELNQDLITFFNQDLTDEKESILAEQLFYVAMKSLKVAQINYYDCVGYKVPLFLNGSDTVDNYEICNLEVYWEIQSQIYLQIKDLPPGTNINSIRFE